MVYVVYCYMYFTDNDNHDEPETEQKTAEDTMESIMDYLWDNFIGPRMSELPEEEKDMVGMTGLALKMIAADATLHEETLKNDSLTPIVGNQWERN